MYKLSVLLIIVFSVNQNIWGQEPIREKTNYQAVYDLEYQKDSTDIGSKQDEKMILFIGNHYSLFQSYNKRYNDSLVKSLADNNGDMSEIASEAIARKKRSRFNFKILKSKDKTLVYDSYFSDKFIYEDNEKFDWEITTRRDTINGYPSTLAKTNFAGRKYKAWFTDEIPISDGPYKFKGLPGLIIKIEDSQKQYIFKLLSFQKKKDSFEFDPDKGAKVSKREFFKAYNNFKKNFIAQLSVKGIEVDDDSRETQKRVQKSRNNAIEIRY